MNHSRVIVKYYVTGGYRGMRETFGKRITGYFNTFIQALTYKQCYSVFSESLGSGSVVKEEFYF